ncbi:MAG: histidine kinase [Bacteroidetes bacterium]|nr:histidine kinase [Bacteroidota bacterium]
MRKIYNIIFFLFSISIYHSQNRELDSLKTLLKGKAHDSIRLSFLSNFLKHSGHFAYHEYSGIMIELAQKNVNLSKAGSHSLKLYLTYLGEAYYYKAEDLLLRMDLPGAILSYEKSITINNKTGNKLLTATGKAEMANALILQENYKKAIEILYEALKILQPLNEQKTIGDVYKNIARIYRRQKNYDKAIEFYEKGFNAYETAGYKLGALEVLHLLSHTYSSINDSTKSDICILKTEKIINTLNENEKSTQAVLINFLLGRINEVKGNNALAIIYFTKNIAPLKEAKVLTELGFIYSSLSNIYKKTKQYKKAIFYAEEAQKMYIQTHHENRIQNGNKMLYQLHKLTGNHKKALEKYELFISMDDSIQSKKDEKHVLEAELKYQFEKKELLVKIAAEKKINELNLLAERKNTRKNTILIIMASALLLFITGACFLYYYYRQRNIIQEQKNNLLKQKLLLSQMNPHFIFNSLNAIQNYIFKKNVFQAGVYLSQFAEMIRMILEFSRKDYITLESELKFLDNYLKLQQLRFENKFDYQLIIDKEIDAETTLLPPMMAQPFIENAVEHGIFYKTSKGNINVNFHKNNNQLVYTIEDDGVGLDQTKKIKLQKGQKHESLAMVITNERIQELYNNPKKQNVIDLIDKKDLNLNLTGVMVKFSIQFKEL